MRPMSSGWPGAGFRMQRLPSRRTTAIVWYTVSTGTSSCRITQSARSSTGTAASTSPGSSRSFAPLITMMRFCPVDSTKIGATPLDTPLTMLTCSAPIPCALKLAMVAGPKRSSPTRATMSTSAPHNRAATAWLAPFPPHPMSKWSPKIVWPGDGNLSVNVVRSTFAEPTTQMRGLATDPSPSLLARNGRRSPRHTFDVHFDEPIEVDIDLYRHLFRAFGPLPDALAAYGDAVVGAGMIVDVDVEVHRLHEGRIDQRAQRELIVHLAAAVRIAREQRAHLRLDERGHRRIDRDDGVV